MKTKTYRYGGLEITIDAKGTIVASTSPAPAFAVGQKVAPARLRACGWKPVKAAVQYDAFGRRMG